MALTTKLLLLVFLVACSFSPESIDYSRARKAEKKQDYSSALKYYQRVISRSKEGNRLAVLSAKSGARIAFIRTKEYRKAAKLYQYVVLHAGDGSDRIHAQKMLTDIYFDHLADYQRAIVELNRLLEILGDEKEQVKYRFLLAKAYFFLNNFFQAQTEASTLQEKKMNRDQAFSVQLLQANILFNLKKVDEAIGVFSKLLSQYPQRSAQENVGLSLAACYEEKSEFKKSMEILRKMRATYPTPEFIDLKIKRLKERQALQPGARGLRR